MDANEIAEQDLTSGQKLIIAVTKQAILVQSRSKKICTEQAKEVEEIYAGFERRMREFLGASHVDDPLDVDQRDRLKLMAKEASEAAECLTDQERTTAGNDSAQLDKCMRRARNIQSTLRKLNAAYAAHQKYLAETTPAPVDRPDEWIPPKVNFQNPERIYLEMDNPETMEGELKQKLLTLGESGVLATVGARKTTSVVGLGGVGKTTAMRGLAEDKEILDRFTGGIYFMEFGINATQDKAIDEIARIVESTGGVKLSKKIRDAKSLMRAVILAKGWFKDKACLFLCDNLWPTTNDRHEHGDRYSRFDEQAQKYGFFPDLTALTMCDSGARMVISTRSSDLASYVKTTVKFDFREPLGRIARKMFMTHADIGEQERGVEFDGLLRKLLEMCGGMPLLIGVVARRLAAENSDGVVNSRLVNQVRELEQETVKRARMQDALGTEYPSCFVAAVMCSVKFLDREMQADEKHIDAIVRSACDLFLSFSILRNQTWMPMSVLDRLWKTTVASEHVHQLNLLCLIMRSEKEWSICRKGPHLGKKKKDDGVTLHDLILQITKMEMEETLVGEEKNPWHDILLNSYMAPIKD